MQILSTRCTFGPLQFLQTSKWTNQMLKQTRVDAGAKRRKNYWPIHNLTYQNWQTIKLANQILE